MGAKGLAWFKVRDDGGLDSPLDKFLSDAERAGLALGADIEALRGLPAERLFGLTAKLTPAMRGLTTPRVPA